MCLHLLNRCRSFPAVQHHRGEALGSALLHQKKGGTGEITKKIRYPQGLGKVLCMEGNLVLDLYVWVRAPCILISGKKKGAHGMV